MKFNNEQLSGVDFFQGDVQFFGLNNVPEGAKPVAKNFLAESELSGSFHALCGNYKQFEIEEGTTKQTVVKVNEECVLNHSLKSLLNEKYLDTPVVLPKKDHESLRVPVGVYYVDIQQKFDALTGYKENVRD